jgi:hypothetical protein
MNPMWLTTLPEAAMNRTNIIMCLFLGSAKVTDVHVSEPDYQLTINAVPILFKNFDESLSSPDMFDCL